MELMLIGSHRHPSLALGSDYHQLALPWWARSRHSSPASLRASGPGGFAVRFPQSMRGGQGVPFQVLPWSLFPLVPTIELMDVPENSFVPVSVEGSHSGQPQGRVRVVNLGPGWDQHSARIGECQQVNFSVRAASGMLKNASKQKLPFLRLEEDRVQGAKPGCDGIVENCCRLAGR